MINRDDQVGRNILTGLQPQIKTITFSLENPGADIYCRSMSLSAEGILVYIETPWGKGELKSSLLGNLISLICLQLLLLPACREYLSKKFYEPFPC